MPRIRHQSQVSGPGSVSIQVGGNLRLARDEPWWCDCDEMVGPHVHCIWGGKGPHMHAVDIPLDHRKRKGRPS